MPAGADICTASQRFFVLTIIISQATLSPPGIATIIEDDSIDNSTVGLIQLAFNEHAES